MSALDHSMAMAMLILMVIIPCVAAVAYWYIEVHSPKKHMKEAIREANAIMARYKSRSSPVATTPKAIRAEK